MKSHVNDFCKRQGLIEIGCTICITCTQDYEIYDNFDGF